MLNITNESEKLVEALKPHFIKLIKHYTRECLRAKKALVSKVYTNSRGTRCDILLNANSLDDEHGEKLHDIKVLPGANIKVGDLVLVEYFYSLNNAFVRNKLK